MRYDIPTLLALRQSGHIDPARLSSGVLDDILLRRRKDERRVLSERSLNSSKPDSKPDGKVGAVASSTNSRVIQPRRQPSNPPHTLSQSDAGFAKFLKEHSSPKHQRVTAGGRIVPMDGPAPKLKLPARRRGASGTVEDQRQADQLSDAGLRLGLPMAVVMSPELMTDPTKPHIHGYRAENQGPQESTVHWDTPSNPPPSPHAAPRGDQLAQTGQKFFEYFPMQPDMAYGHGVDRASWPSGGSASCNVSNQAAASALASTHPHSSTSSSSTAYSQLLTPFSFAPNSLSPGFAETADQPAHGWGTVVYSYNDIYSDNPGPQAQNFVTAEEPQDIIKTHKALSVELSQLDRYMAVHTWDIDTTLKRVLVERRVRLVRELDAARIRKEQLEAGAHLIQKAQFDPRHQLWVPSQLPQCQLMGGIGTQGANLPRPPEALATCGVLPFSASVLVDPQTSMLPAMQPFSATSKSPSLITHLFQGISADSSTVGLINDQCAVGEAQWCQDWASNTNSAEEDAFADFVCPRLDTIRSLPELQRLYEAIADANCRGEPIGHLLQELTSITMRRATGGPSKASQRQPSQAKISPSRKRLPPSQASRDVSFSQPTAGNLEINRVQEADSEVQLRQPVMTAHIKGKSEGVGYLSPRRVQRQVCSLEGRGGMQGAAGANRSVDESWSTDSSSSGSWSIRDGGGRTTPRNQNEGQPGSAAGVDADEVPATQKDDCTVEAEHSSGPDGEHRANDMPCSSIKSIGPSRKDGTKPRKPYALTIYGQRLRASIIHKAMPLAVPLTINAHAFLPRFDGADDTPSQGFSKPDSDEYFASERSALAGRGMPEQSAASTPGQWFVKTERTRPSPSIISAFFRRIKKEEDAMIQKYASKSVGPSTEG